MENDRELEGVVVSCMYAGLKRKLNQQQRRVEIAWAMGRDVGPDDLDAMISKLDSWCTSADCVVAALQRIEDAAPENSAAGNTDEPADSNFGAAEASSNRNEGDGAPKRAPDPSSSIKHVNVALDAMFGIESQFLVSSTSDASMEDS